jgi:hypothetical protein
MVPLPEVEETLNAWKKKKQKKKKQEKKRKNQKIKSRIDTILFYHLFIPPQKPKYLCKA